MALATLQQLRSFNVGEFPPNLEPGQIAFNMSSGNWDVTNGIYDMFMFVGNGTSIRQSSDGTIITTEGELNKGWVRYSLSSGVAKGGTVFGNFTVSGGVLAVEANATTGAKAELVVPKNTGTPTNGTQTGSVRWNIEKAILQAWNGAKWDTTSKVSVGATAPANPSNGDLWFDVTSTTIPILYVYYVPSSGAAQWLPASFSAAATALQPGNGVTANEANQIDIINPGDY